jgi:hypothetical protein
LVHAELDNDANFHFLDSSIHDDFHQQTTERKLQGLGRHSEENAMNQRDCIDQLEEPECRDICGDKKEETNHVLYRDNAKGEVVLKHADNQDYDTLGSFFQRPYFSRRWIIQEVSLAPKIAIYCGATVFYTDVTRAIWEVVRLRNHNWAGREGAVAMAEMLIFRQRQSMPSPMVTLSNFPHFQCRDEKDHVFGMIGVFEWTLRKEKHFAPDHFLRTVSYGSDIADVYTAVAQYQLSFDSEIANVELPTLVGAMKHTDITVSNTGKRVPSWVPDWRHLPDTSTISRSSHDSGLYWYEIDSTGVLLQYGDKELDEVVRHFAIAWASLHMPFCVVQPFVLQIYGLPIDTIEDTIHLDISSHAERERLQSWLSSGGSLLEVISESLVALCHVMF